MFDFFVEKAIRVVMLAQEEAQRLNHPFMGTDHLLLGLIAAKPVITAEIFRSLGITLTATRTVVEKIVGKGSVSLSKEVQFSPRCRQVLAQSLKEAQKLGQSAVDAEHLLLAMLWDEDGSAMRVLAKLDVDCDQLRTDIIQAIAEATPEPSATNNPPKPEKTPILDSCGVNLTKLATMGRLDPVVGRQSEIERLIQILSRRTKNNPILIGEPGVGKTALAEGLAQRIVDHDLPESFHNKQVITLNVGSLLAGTKYRGEFEERLKTIMGELRSAGNVILVIDEVHTLIGAGSPEGALDAANILKPALARGELQCIGATTLDEYRQHFERDAALARRFQPVMINEPSVDETILILQGLRSCYERHHRLMISDLALEAAAKFSNRYISDRFLPDKAIDLMDEAGSHVRILSSQQQSSPSKDLNKALQQILKKKDTAVQEQEFAQASALQGEEMELMKKISPVVPDAFGSRSVVSEADIAHVVSSWTGIPVGKLTESESEQLLHMEEILHRRLIGQTEAVKAIARATRRGRAGLQNPNRPIASFIFAGPTGVGKTELVKALAISFFGAEAAMIRLDMSEYMERHTIAKLIGSPPGYVGYGEGGQLTEAVRRKPYTVILFDEIEKAHPDIANLLLQILDEGHLTDAKGRTVSFKNTLLVMTSNVGSKLIQKGVGGLGFNVAADQANTHYRNLVTLVNEELKEYFRPEFLNRLDEVIVFRQLTKDEVKQIADILLRDFQSRLTEQTITLTVTDRFKDYLIEAGYNPEQGARPLRRAITRLLEDNLAEAILSRQVQSGDAVIVDIDSNNEVQILREGATTDVVPR